MTSCRASYAVLVLLATVPGGALATPGGEGGYSPARLALTGCTIAQAAAGATFTSALTSALGGCGSARAPSSSTPRHHAAGFPAAAQAAASSNSGALDGIIHTDGHGHLTLNGSRFQFVGVDAFELATYWNINFGCGSEIASLDGFFGSLTPNSVIRFWAFQDFTQSKVTGGRDWTPIDRVVRAAERAHQRLIFVLGDQWANCHGEQYKDAAFYTGGYKSQTPRGEGETYWRWVHDVVYRYRYSPAVAMWEPLNEAQGDCVKVGAWNLQHFFDSVGDLIKSIDSKHLVESGLLGSNQCGTTLGDYVIAQNVSDIDVVSYHDYGDPASLPAGLKYRLEQAETLNKPLIVGEVGFLSDCGAMQAKQAAQFAAGVSGFMPWNWDGPGAPTCGF